MDSSLSRYMNRRPNSSGQSSTPQSSQSHLSQSSSSSPLIPDPAGVVQSAMRRKILNRQSLSSQESPIATQEYIRRAIEDPVKNEDFQDSPWLSAMKFLTEADTYYPLSSIKKKCHNIDRVDQVDGGAKKKKGSSFMLGKKRLKIKMTPLAKAKAAQAMEVDL